MKLTEELWKDSQENELHFWKTQLDKDNEDQRQRNQYYLSVMEGRCSLIKDFLAENDITNKVVMDLGSGPQGILHVLHAKRKIAVDPLMDRFRDIGFPVDKGRVDNFNLKAEEIGKMFKEEIDIVFCLNSIDHHQDPSLVIDNIKQVLKKDGDLILLTDLRLPEQCDAYHKLPLTREYILGSLEGFDLIDAQTFPHGPGNPIIQFIIHARKK